MEDMIKYTVENIYMFWNLNMILFVKQLIITRRGIMRIKRTISLIFSILLIFTLLFSSIGQADQLSQEKINLMRAAGEIIPEYEEIDEASLKISKEEAISIGKTILDKQKNYEVSNINLNPKNLYSGRVWYIDYYLKQTQGGNANVGIDADTGEIMSFGSWESYNGQTNFIASLTREEARVKAEEYLKEIFRVDIETLELNKEYPYANMYRNGVKEPIIYNFVYNKKIDGIVINNATLSIGVDGTDGKLRNYYNNKIDIDTSKLPSTKGVMNPDNIVEKHVDNANITLQYITMYEERLHAPAKIRIALVYTPTNYANTFDAFTGDVINYDGTVLSPMIDENKKSELNLTPLDPNARLEEGKPIAEKEAKAIAEKYKVAAEELLGVKFLEGREEYYFYPNYNWNDDVWNFNWNLNIDNTNAYLNIAINCKTGRIINLNMNRYDYNNEIQFKEGKQPEIIEKVSWQQGKEKALEIVKKIIPEQYGFFSDQNIEEPTIKDEYRKNIRDHNYNFVRIVNGIRYRDNTLGVNINRENGEISNFYFNWQDTDFPLNSEIITLEEAKKLYSDDLEAKLSYFIPNYYEIQDEKVDQVTMLAYSIKSKTDGYLEKIIDAKTGKMMDWSGRERQNQICTELSQLPEHAAKRSVELLISQGVIKEFKVDFEREITRGEVVRMMSIAKGMAYFEPVKDAKQTFTDIEEDNENYYYIENAIKHNIVTKIGGKFGADEKITKDEYVKFLVNMLEYSELAKHSKVFSKEGFEEVSEEAIGSVAICSAFGLLPVKTGEPYDGESTLTFAEAAESMYKALYYIR